MSSWVCEPEDLEDDPYMELTRAIQEGDMDHVVQLLGNKQSCDIVPPKHLSPFVNPAAIEAILSGHGEILEYILEQYPSAVESVMTSGGGLLHCAAAYGDALMLSNLLEKHAFGIQAVDWEGMTPLHYGAYKGSKICCALLVEAGVDVNAVDERGFTPLLLASRGPNSFCVEYLISAGADVNAKDSHGCTPLHHAASCGHARVMIVLLSHGADPTVVEEGTLRGAIHWACYSGSHAAVEVLLAANGGLANTVDRDGDTPLIIASRRGFTDIANTLIEAGASLDAVNASNVSALMSACLFGHETTALVLLDQGAKTNIEHTTWKRSALHYAALGGHPGIVAALTQRGCDCTKDREGFLPKELAAELDYEHLLILL